MWILLEANCLFVEKFEAICGANCETYVRHMTVHTKANKIFILELQK